MRWLAGIGTDYGVAVVRNDSPYTDLKGLMEAFKQDPTKIVLGAAAPWQPGLDEGRADRQGGGRTSGRCASWPSKAEARL